MGNANGREEVGSGSKSGVEDGGGAQVNMADRDGAHGNYHAHGGEYMGQSSPPSPRASQSPLMFRPQVSFVVFFSNFLWIFGMPSVFFFCFL